MQKSLFFIFVLGFAGACALNPVDDSKSIVTFHSSDLANFWRAFDLSKGKSVEDCQQIFENEYKNVGSKGLQDFYELRIDTNTSLCKTIKKFRPYYDQFRNISPNLDTYSAEIVDSFRKLKKIYPETKPVEVYYLIGKTTTAGTIKGNRLLIGLEMFASGDKSVRSSVIPEHLIPYSIDFSKLTALVVHELIHTQQNLPKDLETLLEYTIVEGSADYLTELIHGAHPNHRLYRYGFENEIKLKEKFKKIMNGKDLKPFLYNAFENPNPDLGYFSGYRVTESYFQHKGNIEEAVAQTLNIKDFKSYLRESHYLQ